MMRVTVSGSFNRHLEPIADVVSQLAALGIKCLSPVDPRVVDCDGPFLFIASDESRSVRKVQDGHLEAITGSDFLWLVSPDGYVGRSASMEIGYAVSAGVPIFSTTMVVDRTLREYITVVDSLAAAVAVLKPEQTGLSVEDIEAALERGAMDAAELHRHIAPTFWERRF